MTTAQTEARAIAEALIFASFSERELVNVSRPGLHALTENFASTLSARDAKIKALQTQVERLTKALAVAIEDITTIDGHDRQWSKLIRMQHRAETAEARLAALQEKEGGR